MAIVEVGLFPRMKAGGDALNNLALDCLCNLLKQIRGVRMRRDRGLCQYMQQLQLIKQQPTLKYLISTCCIHIHQDHVQFNVEISSRHSSVESDRTLL